MKLHRAVIILGLLSALFALQPATAEQATSHGTSPTRDGVDTLEFFIGEPDSIVGYAFDYTDAGTRVAHRSRCFVNYFVGEAGSRLLTMAEIAELMNLLRAAREISTEFDGQFSACCGIPTFGFEVFRGGRAGCLELYLCECRCGWTFSRRGYIVGGVCPEMLDRFRTFGENLVAGR